MPAYPLPKPRDVYKTCNHNALGCQRAYNLTERAKKEKIAEQKRLNGYAAYKMFYDACDNPNCQKLADTHSAK